MTISGIEIKYEDLAKIEEAAKKIKELSDQQDFIHERLVRELGVTELGDDLIYDFNFNWFEPKDRNIKKVSFLDYLKFFQLCPEPFYK